MPSGAPASSGGLDGVWKAVRAAARLLAFALANLGVALVFFLGLPPTVGDPERRRRWRNAIFAAWARVSLACAGVRVAVRGAPPRGPCFLVANHLVYLDIWLLAASTSAVFVAESGIERWPFFGFMARRLSIIFIDRANKRTIPEVNRRIDEALATGNVLVVFPEGTNGDGKSLLPFRSSLLEPAARGGFPVHWASITYSTRAPDPPASQIVVWKKGVRLLHHAWKLLLLDRVDATITFGEEAVRGTDRKALAAELQRRVGGGLAPLD
ncbi:MAG: lysophospholipid acyltransferase family protein [Planctomycetota bacterium]